MKILENPILAPGRAIYADNYYEEGIRHPTLSQKIFNPRFLRDYLKDMSGMATLYGDEWTKVRAFRKVAPASYGGKPRIISFTFASLAAGTLADVLVCGKIYKGDTVIFGKIISTALSSGGGTASGAVGTYAVASDGVTVGAVDSSARFLAATSFDAAAVADLGAASSLVVGTGFLFTATADLFLTILNSGEAFATAGTIAGWLLVVRD